MKEHWKKQLDAIEDVDERRLLRELLNTVVKPIEEYRDADLKEIKQQVFDEVKIDDEEFAIYGSIIKRSDYDGSSGFLHPMNESDLEEIPTEIDSITTAFENNEKPSLGKLYVNLDYLELNKIKKALQDRKFKGFIKTSQNVHEIEVSLIPYTGYIKQITKLYELFTENKLEWRTILHPKIHKFLQIQLETKIPFKKHEKIEKITIDVEELKSHTQDDQVPLWNIKKTSFSSYGKQATINNKECYEHTLLYETSTTRKLGYLFDNEEGNDEIINIRKEDDKMVLTSPKDIISKWSVWTTISPLESEIANFNITSNRKKESFIDHYSRKRNRQLKTVGEIYRIANLSVDTSEVKLIDTKYNALQPENIETYELNPFIKDEIRADEDRKIMKLTFETEKITPIARDIVSFITSELQLFYAQVKFVSELVQKNKPHEKEKI